MKTVKQLLADKSGKLHTIPSESRVIDALRMMAEHNVGALLVVDDGRLAGVISERDYARKIILQGKSSPETRVREIMTAQVTCVGPDKTAGECMALMSNGHFRHLPVLDGDKLIGVLSIGDLVKEVIADQAQTIKHLETYIRT
jgi:CBS domain-containing protein